MIVFFATFIHITLLNFLYSCMNVLKVLKCRFFSEGVPFNVEAQMCEGFRCKLGNCIEQEKVCDGFPDCRSAEDEDKAMCGKRQCHESGDCSKCLKTFN